MEVLAVFGLILVALSLGIRFGQQALRTQTATVAVTNDIGPVDELGPDTQSSTRTLGDRAAEKLDP